MSNERTKEQRNEDRRTRHGLQDRVRKHRADRMRLRVPARYRLISRREQEENRAKVN